MKRAVVPLLVWATFLAGTATLLAIWTRDWISIAMLGGAAVLTYLIAIGFAIVQWRTPDASEAGEHPELSVRAVPDLSFGAALCGIAIAAMVFGAEFGLFLVLIGAGLLAIGLVRVAAERYSERRDTLARLNSRIPPARIDPKDIPR